MAAKGLSGEAIGRRRRVWAATKGLGSVGTNDCDVSCGQLHLAYEGASAWLILVGLLS